MGGRRCVRWGAPWSCVHRGYWGCVDTLVGDREHGGDFGVRSRRVGAREEMLSGCEVWG